MTANMFAWLCTDSAVDPEIALENEAIREALAARDDDEVKRILLEEF